MVARDQDVAYGDRELRYAAFISYRHVDPDRRWAEWLHKRMETYRVPRRLVTAGLPRRVGRMFRDEEELSASADLSASIDEALTAARYLIVVCSRRTPQSRWVNEEVERFREMGRTDRILALLVDGEPEDAFPPALLELEPLAADVRPTPTGAADNLRKTALLKLLSAVLGVRFDDLRQRDEERSRRRLTWVASGAGLATLTFAALALFSAVQWVRAEAELRQSRAQSLANAAQAVLLESERSQVRHYVDPQRAVLLALESLRISHSIQADRILRAALAQLDGPPLQIPVGWDTELVGFGADGRGLAIRAGSAPKILDLRTGETRDPGPNEPPPQTDWAMRTDEIASRATDLRCPGDEYAIARAPTASVCACATPEPGVRLRRGCEGPPIAFLPHEWYVHSALFSPDGQWLLTVTPPVGRDPEEPSATALVGSTVRIWPVSRRRAASLWDILASPRELRLWQPAIGRPWSEIAFATEGNIDALALDPQTGWLAMQVTSVSSEDESHYLLLWPLWPEVLREEACRRLERNLSPTEWASFIPVEPYRPTCPGLPVISE